MPDSQLCLNARAALDELYRLQGAFDEALKALNQDWTDENVTGIKMLRTTIEAKLHTLQELLHDPELEKLFDLRKQYKDQVALLKLTELLETKEDGTLFMTGIDKDGKSKEYILPSYTEIALRMKEKKEILETKANQGFKKLLLVPFGMSLDVLMEKFKVYLKDKPHGLDVATVNPFWNWDAYDNADTNGTLVYDPEFFNENHKGMTKKQLLGNPKNAWRIVLLQGESNTTGFRKIPRKGETIAERPDIEAGKSANEYLALLNTDSQYKHESGMTPEEWICLFMAHLEETQKPIDDVSGPNGESVSLLLGAFFPGHASVPYAHWNRNGRQANLDRHGPDEVYEYLGARSSVRV